ncbi:MAG: beta strand repeat-containing protein [Flavobacteriaceae bacterium]
MKQQFLLLLLLLCSSFAWAQNADLELDDRTQIIIPPQGSTVQFCQSSGSNLTFRVVNRSSGAANVIDLNANNLVATLTLTGNTFSPSGTTSSAIFNSASSSTATSTQYLAATGWAEFTWPVALQFNGTGTTTVNVEVAVIGNTDSNSANNSTTYVLEVLPNPNPPSITTNYGSNLINICPGDEVIITSSPVGNEYEFYRNNVLLGPRQSSNVFTTSSLNNNDLIEVVAFFTNNCTSPSGSTLLVNVGTVPVGSFTSDAPNNTVCQGGDVLFTANGGGWYEFLVNNISQGASSTTATFNLTNVLNDNRAVTVRTWTNSSSICYDEDTINIRLNSLSGVNQISNTQTICAGDDPAILISNSILTADRAGEGATISYQWQRRTAATAFADITGANSVTYDPSIITTTTYYRRLIYSTFEGVQCPSSDDLAASNVVTVTANPNSVASLQTNALNNTVCQGDDVFLDASPSSDSQSYLFFINGIAQGSVQSAATYTLSALDVSDNMTVAVQSFNGPGGSGCSSMSNLTIRLNSFSGNNIIDADQNLCAGQTPSTLTNIASPTIDRSGDGAIVTYQWQSRQGSNSFTNVIGATALEYTPSSVATTTQFRRQIISTLNGVSCILNSDPVELTITGGLVPTVSVSTGNLDHVVCPDDNIVIDASGSSGAQSYSYALRGIILSGSPTSSASRTISSGLVNDNDAISVIAYSGLSGTGCSSTVSFTIRLNSIAVSNTLSGAQSICSGDDPTQISGSAASASLGGSISYQWQSRTGTNTFVNIGGATAQNYNPPILTETTDFKRITSSTVSGSTCTVESSPITININPELSVNLSGGESAVCSGDNIVFTATGGDFFEFFVNGVSVRASSTSNTTSMTTLNDGEEVTVLVTNAQGCSSLSTPTTINISTVPSVALSSGFAANIICQGEFPVFTATPADPSFTYSFYIDGIYQNLGVASNTFDSSQATYTILDNSVISVVVDNAAGCNSSSTLNMRVLSISGSNSISGSQTLCVGGDPTEFTSNAIPVADAAGSTLNFQWQSKTASGTFVDIPGANAASFDPSPLSATTAFRRLVYVSMGTKSCPDVSNLASATSNIVTVTVDSTALPVISFVSGATNNVICEGDDLTFDASGTTGAASFEYFIDNISQGPSSTATTLFVPSGTLSDTSTVRVHATSATASPCFSSFTITMRVNSITGANTIGNGQNICTGDDPALLTSVAVPTADIGGASVSYLWQSRTATNAFSDIAGTNSVTFDPPTLSETTDFQRVTLVELNGVSCAYISNAVTVAVDPLPTPTLLGTNTACIGETVNFSATGGVIYEFFRNGVSLSSASTQTTLSRNDLVAGDQIMVAVTNTDSCTSNSLPITMVISTPPSAALSSGLTANTMCEGDFPVFIASPASSDFTYDFYVNGTQQIAGVSTNTFDTSLAWRNRFFNELCIVS